MTPIRSNIISKHSLGRHSLCTVEAQNISAWCRIPGSPFFDGLFLMPNHPSVAKVAVKFGPFSLADGIDAFSCCVSSSGRSKHRNIIKADLGILDAGGVCFNRSKPRLACGEAQSLTLPFEPQESGDVYLTFGTEFDELVDKATYGGIEIRNIIGFKRNALVELFDRLGSDKGTACSAGNGAPHCYAVEYFRLFQQLQEEQFNFLEIGLDNTSKETGRPQDAPSLRAWRQFFPKACIYGYDLNDFSFLQQAGTHTFRGDQASREDINRFLAEFGHPEFKVIVDDGSHASSHQQISLAGLFPSVAPGGMYLIEDLGWQPLRESPKTLDLLVEFSKTGKMASPFLMEAEAKYLEDKIARVEIYKPNDSEFAVIYKRH